MKILFPLLICTLLFITGSAQVSRDSSYTLGNGLIWQGKVSNGKMTGQWQLTKTDSRIVRAVVFYENGLKEGVHTYYQDNGKLQSIYHYHHGELEGKTIHFTGNLADTLGIINYSGGLLHGDWQINNWKGEFLQIIKWEKGVANTSTPYHKLTRITRPHIEYEAYLDDARKYIGLYYEHKNAFQSVDENAQSNSSDSSSSHPPPPPPPPGSEGALMFAEQMPMFPGGEAALMKYLQENLRFPVSIKERGISGTVHITFLVNPDGTISDYEITRSVKDAPELSGEAVRVVSLMPVWTPGKLNGKNVKVTISLPIRFLLR